MQQARRDSEYNITQHTQENVYTLLTSRRLNLLTQGKTCMHTQVK